MKQSEVITVGRALRVALGYESRELRIHALRNNNFLDVRFLMKELEGLGMINEAGTSVADMMGHFKDPI